MWFVTPAERSHPAEEWIKYVAEFRDDLRAELVAGTPEDWREITVKDADDWWWFNFERYSVAPGGDKWGGDLEFFRSWLGAGRAHFRRLSDNDLRWSCSAGSVQTLPDPGLREDGRCRPRSSRTWWPRWRPSPIPGGSARTCATPWWMSWSWASAGYCAAARTSSSWRPLAARRKTSSGASWNSPRGSRRTTPSAGASGPSVRGACSAVGSSGSRAFGRRRRRGARSLPSMARPCGGPSTAPKGWARCTWSAPGRPATA